MPEAPLSLSVGVGAYPHTRALKSGRIASAELQTGIRRDFPDQPRFRPDGSRAALRRLRNGDRDFSAGQGLWQGAGSAADRDGGAVSGIGAALPQRTAPFAGRRISRAGASACAPTARRRECGCAVCWRRRWGAGPRTCAGSPSRARMWSNMPIRPSLSGRARARKC